MKKFFRILAVSFFTLLVGIGLLTSHVASPVAVYAAEGENEPMTSLVLRAKAPDEDDKTKVKKYLRDNITLEASSFNVQIKEIGGSAIVTINKIKIGDKDFDEELGNVIELDDGSKYFVMFSTLKWIGDGNVECSSSVQDETGKTIKITGTDVTSAAKATCTMYVTFSTYEDGELGGQASLSFTLNQSIIVSVSRSFWQTVSSLLSNSTVFILIVTTCVTIIGRSAIKIFRFGVNYKSNFATVEQQEKFESSIRQELRANKTETQDAVLKICLREINRETRPLKDIQEMAEKLRTDREILDIRLNSIDQKYNEIRKLSENINQLEQKVNRLQYGEGGTEVRRSGK